jgi:hypothetical protein
MPVISLYVADASVVVVCYFTEGHNCRNFLLKRPCLLLQDSEDSTYDAIRHASSHIALASAP